MEFAPFEEVRGIRSGDKIATFTLRHHWECRSAHVQESICMLSPGTRPETSISIGGTLILLVGTLSQPYVSQLFTYLLLFYMVLFQ